MTTFSTPKQMLLHRSNNRRPGTTSCATVGAAGVLAGDDNRRICLTAPTEYMATMEAARAMRND